jgi:hypothetical protein
MTASPYRKPSGFRRHPALHWTAGLAVTSAVGFLGAALFVAAGAFVVALAGPSAYQLAKRGVDFTPDHNLTVAWNLLANWPAGAILAAIGLATTIFLLTLDA